MRSYRQFCPAARALDVIGERWTLLIVRDLLFGPKRYSDLQAGLPGIGPTLLAERLRSLEDAGVVERHRLPPPAASTVYALTELGEELRGVLAELFRWGMRTLGPPGAKDALRASWLVGAVEAVAQPEAVPDGVDETYEFRVGDEVMAVHAHQDGIDARQGAAESPALVVETDHETFAALGLGRTTPAQAIRRKRLAVDGDPGAIERCSRLFGLLDATVAS